MVGTHQKLLKEQVKFCPGNVLKDINGKQQVQIEQQTKQDVLNVAKKDLIPANCMVISSRKKKRTTNRDN